MTIMKKLRMLLILLAVSVCSLQNAWAQDEVSVEVTLPEPNSLSTEILKQVEDVKTVTDLTVLSGSLGDKDWATLKSMVALKNLNLTNASAEAIPEEQFRGNCPNLESVYLPSYLKNIGEYAFYSKDKLVTVVVPSTIETIGVDAFSYCGMLENCDLSACNKIEEIPNNCFQGCSVLKSFEIPANVKRIGLYSFYDCSAFSSDLPTNVEEIRSGAFKGAAMTDMDIVIPEGLSLNSEVFAGTRIKSIAFPTNCYKFGDYVRWCQNITDITLKSPTVLPFSNTYQGPENIDNITLHVPSHLVDLYKTHTYWSNYKEVVAIEDPIPSYDVQANLELNYAMRMSGTPSLKFILPNSSSNLFLKISGDDAQTFNDFSAAADLSSDYSQYYTMILSECPNVSISGDFKQRIRFYNNQWRYVCLPFDFKVGDVVAEEGKFAVRTYNGALRNSQNLASNNWTNLEADDVVPAGTGFIVQTSKSTWLTFKAVKTGSNYAFKTSTDEIKIPLALNNANTEASAANTGWNMVGNPWMTYYNSHKLNYTAPFCYYDYYRYRYVTVSPSDDDYAIPPLQAIFVQCPSGVSSIDFPASGRQLTSEITDQNGARRRTASNRQLFDVQVSGSDGLSDKTRLVMNPEAKNDYEIGRDAAKFLSYETECPQIYSLDAEDTQYAINERPEGNGTLRLGLIFASDGIYEISAIRNEVGDIILTDNETGIRTNLRENSYRFDVEAGTVENRFTLSFGAGTTGIQHVAESEDQNVEVFTLDGQNAGNSTDGLRKGVYVVRKGNKAQKVIIK